LLSPFFIQAQEFDKSFLSSLPVNLQDDFLSEVETNESNDTNYPNPETRINNLEQALADAEQTLQKIKKDLEKDDVNLTSQLKRIGDNFFQTYQSTFLPINEPNVDPTYILDFGDEITLQLIGQKNFTNKVRIKRDGSINIEDIGNITLSGLSLQEATSLIKNKIAQAFIGVEAFISLSDLRDMNVLIVGNAVNPGMYTLNGGSSPLSLIHAAGGIDKFGSFRSITHKRNNQVLQEIDLYEILLKGNLVFTHQLRSGDALVVNPRISQVRVSGSFANPGIYEILPSENLGSLIKLSGIQQNHINNFINIERYGGSNIQSFDIELQNAESFVLKDGDSVSLLGSTPQFNKAKHVTISGEVNAPGLYTLDDNSTLSDLIRKAGSYTKNAYPIGGILMREKVKELEIASKEKSYNELLRYLVASPNFSSILGSPDSNGIITFLSLLKDYEPVGRLMTEFSLAKLDSDPSLDRILEDGDIIHIPSYSPDIYVFGEVMSPGSVLYSELAYPSKYIDAAGGLSRVADLERILLILPTGEVNVVTKSKFQLLQKNYMVLPGSTIYVPRQVGKLDGINLASTVAPIVSSVALSLASLNSINN
jgi:protein involved in polysaccharide export with SLBB domain